MSKNQKQKVAKHHEPIDHARFLQLLADEFPEVPEAFDESGKGLIHCEMGFFAGVVDEAIKNGKLWQVERYFNFVDRVRKCATADVENAIDVSFIEYFALDEFTEQKHQALKRMPSLLRLILLEIDGRGRWK